MLGEDNRIAEAWAAVTDRTEPRPKVQVVGDNGSLPSVLATEDVAVASVSVALMTALHPNRTSRPSDIEVHRGQVAEAMRSERRFIVNGQPAGMGFAPLSGFWKAADGWVRTHANYPWHKEALLNALDVCDNDAGTVGTNLAGAIAELAAHDVEDRVFKQGGVAVRVRSPQEWSVGEQGQRLDQEELVGHCLLPGAAPRRRPPGPRLADGVRVLDMTRVIAGPVGTRFLGALGADVLRIDGPKHLDLIRGEPADTLLGKRTAELDCAVPLGLAALHDLLDSADVLVTGYRPGALDKFGLGDGEMAERHPGLVMVRLAAWGHSGHWAARRGFDSIVQAATGISMVEARGGEPGALPCQLLDHATGYLAAAAALDGLRRQGMDGGTHVRTLSLARTAQWLLESTPETGTARPPTAHSGFLVRVASNGGDVDAVAPPGRLRGTPLRWPEHVSGYLDDEPLWAVTP